LERLKVEELSDMWAKEIGKDRTDMSGVDGNLEGKE